MYFFLNKTLIFTHTLHTFVCYRWYVTKVELNYTKGTEINDKSNKSTKSKANKLHDMYLSSLIKGLREKKYVLFYTKNKFKFRFNLYNITLSSTFNAIISLDPYKLVSI